MNSFQKVTIFLTCALLYNCGTKKDLLKTTLASDNSNIKRVMDNAALHEIQIIYTQILRDKNGKVSFKDYGYNLDSNNYFYPASTVKFPIAILALEKLNAIANTSVNTEYKIEGNDTKLKFSEEISKVFAVSDNEASTNLFEFMGFDYINQKMEEKGLLPFRLSHRLSGADSSNPLVKSTIIFKNDNTTEVFPSKADLEPKKLQLNSLQKGTGYLAAGNKLINEPFDFSKRNYYPLETLHNTLKRIVFPEYFKESETFKITEKDREFILFSMQNLPKNAGYDPKEYYDGYCKFFMFGDTKENIPSSVKIYNKVGNAYGTMIDCAYIVDTENKVEFMLSATILANKNGIYNDNIYEYDEISLPFLAELGRQLYLKNKK
ncbi:hypothetical protein RCH18_002271 [Flavobacterium sp. PL11]|uniref:serine hydrolase n=1 Tax=Flavobacterium sp. PL11 TaxID=3071717 RepID=UPI002E083E5A|nr:hypothetical protein [Flavobacterium sp. PL11]